MSMNSYGHLFRVTTWGESHGPALGATVDGCPPGVRIDAAMLQHWLDKRKPGQNRYTTQRREPDQVEILSGTYEGQTTGTPIQLMIRNTRNYQFLERTVRMNPFAKDNKPKRVVGQRFVAEWLKVRGNNLRRLFAYKY